MKLKIKTHESSRFDAGPHRFIQLYRGYSIHEFTEKDSDVLLLVFQNENKYRSQFKYKKIITRCDGLYCTNVPGKDPAKLNANGIKRYEEADGVIFQSEYCKKQYESLTNHSVKCPYEIIVNGTDLHYIPNQQRIPGVLCNIGERNIKRPHLIQQLAKKLESSDVKLYVIGGEGEPTKNIVYLGKVPREQLLTYYTKFTTFFHPAYRDSCPNSVVEACKMGMVVVGSESGGVPDIVGNKGLLYHEKKKDDFSWMDKVPDPDIDEIEHLILSSFSMHGFDRTDLAITSIAKRYDNFLTAITRRH